MWILTSETVPSSFKQDSGQCCEMSDTYADRNGCALQWNAGLSAWQWVRWMSWSRQCLYFAPRMWSTAPSCSMSYARPLQLLPGPSNWAGDRFDVRVFEEA